MTSKEDFDIQAIKDYVPDALWDSFKLNPERLGELRVLEASIYLTRDCNLKCQYCKIIKTELEEELSIERWIEAVDILESLGIRFVNIAGGEPTVVKGLSRLISHLDKNTTMDFSVVSNSLFGDNMARELAEAGLRAYVASVDVLGDDVALDDLRKSSAGIKMLAKLKELGVPYLCANIVVSAQNIDKVMDVVRYLSDEGVWVNICPILWGKGDKWDKIEAADRTYRLGPEHKARLTALSKEIIEYKRTGALILPTEQYIEAMPDYGISLSWKCFDEEKPGPPPRLTIDADGAMMTCINMRGDLSVKHSIFDLKDKDLFEEFISDWWRDASSCTGCYWSTMVMAQERQETLERLKTGSSDLF